MTRLRLSQLYRHALCLVAACTLVAACKPTATTSVQIVGSGLVHPRSISLSPQGTLYVADDDGRLFPEKGWLYGISPEGLSKTIELGELIPRSVATDAHGNIYATMMTLRDKGIYKIDPLTGPKRLWTATYPAALAVTAEGDVYVIDALSSTNETIVRITRDGEATVVASHLQNTAALSVDRFNNLYVSDYASIAMIRPNGEKTTIVRGLCTAVALANDNAGELYIVDLGRWQILRVAPDGAVFKIGSGFRGPVGIAFDTRNTAYVVEVGNPGVKKFSLSSVRQTKADLESSCFKSPRELPDN